MMNVKPSSSVVYLCWMILAVLGSVDAAAARQGTITAITLSPATAQAGATVTATVTGTAGPCGAVHINWGEGEAITYATEVLPVTKTRVYKTAGTFDLRAQGMGNCLGEATARIVITAPPPPPPPPPPAVPPTSQLTGIKLSERSAMTRTAVTITLEGTGACSVALDFGDGNGQELRGQLPMTVQHTYVRPGRYSIVADPAPTCVPRRVAVLHVSNPAPAPTPPPAAPPTSQLTGIKLSERSAMTRTAVTITLEGTGACRVTLDFGDGNSEEFPGPLPAHTRHTYALAGRYSIVATPAAPCVERRVAILEVGDPRPQRITGLEVTVPPDGPRSVRAVRILGSGQCSYTVDFGDGNTDRREGTLPDVVRHNYPAEGRYTVVVTAGAPCEGERRSTFTVGRDRR